jgi:Flp pilus assembly CpaF family ATPase
MVDVVERLAGELHLRRGTGPLTVAWEQQLWEAVEEIVEEAIAAPGRVGVEPLLAARLADDGEWRAGLEWCVLVRASLLWPLSLLLYGDTEDVWYLGGGLWVVSDGEVKPELGGEPPRDLGVGSLSEAERRIEQWCRTLLDVPGVHPKVQVSRERPLVDVTLPTARGIARVAVGIPPAAAVGGIYLNVRMRKAGGPETLDDFVDVGTMTRTMAEVLRAAVRARVNIVAAGPTGSGKTSLLAALGVEIPEEEIVLVLEDTPEVGLEQPRRNGEPRHRRTITLATVPAPHKGALASVTTEDLHRALLRYRPDRIICGETRGGECGAVCGAMSSGHEGSMLTLHANTAEQVIGKAVTYMLMDPAYAGQPELAQRIAREAIHLAVHLGFVRGDKNRRVVTSIVAFSELGAIKVLYARDRDTGGWVREEPLRELPARVRIPLSEWIDEIPEP